ncbi:hypothetical protein L3C95_04030 [Chitinophaga filiformis]|uniref:hypothetical protein n=1 Tax=Chitinophaga filiformis TaxID=104663 RepID=UPI001F275128|nr:hypothetical protein [Chitinophaga filiformis]MCF6402027.1 hypothetical protein [Chitinophaga filiformis]
MAKVSSPKNSTATSRDVKKDNSDSIAGAGGGMLIASLARNLPEDNPLKSWLIILAPALALGIKFIWSKVLEYYQQKEIDKTREEVIKEIDDLLIDPSISEDEKIKLREKREKTKLSTVEELLKHFDKITSA